MHKLFYSFCLLTLSTLAIAGQGWTWLNRQLDSITPSIDTQISESRVQLYQRLNYLLQDQQAEAVLAELAKLDAPNDVQLQIFKASAYEDLNQLSKAQSIYQSLTEHYPEIAELWNNLAVIQAKLGQRQQAQQSLQTALLVNPDSKTAKTNLNLLNAQP